MSDDMGHVHVGDFPGCFSRARRGSCRPSSLSELRQGPDLLFIRNLVAEKRPQLSELVPFRGLATSEFITGGRCNRSAYAPASLRIGIPRGGLHAWCSSLHRPPATRARLPPRFPCVLSRQRSPQPTHLPVRAL